jgi:hypothetical protein
MHNFFEALPCVLCSKPSGANLNSLCNDCSRDIQAARFTSDFISLISEKQAKRALLTCASCVYGNNTMSKLALAGTAGDMCLNLDCEDFFKRRKALERVVFDVDTLNKVCDRL